MFGHKSLSSQLKCRLPGGASHDGQLQRFCSDYISVAPPLY